MRLVLAAGSTFQGTGGVWSAGNFYTTAAQANFMSVNTNVAYLKRIQLISGALVQAYKPADIQKELAKAQRYYGKSYTQGVVLGTITQLGAQSVSPFAATANNVGWCTHYFKTTMRAAPTSTVYSPGTGAAANVRDNTGATDLAATIVNIGDQAASTQFNATNGNNYTYHWTANSRLA